MKKDTKRKSLCELKNCILITIIINKTKPNQTKMNDRLFNEGETTTTTTTTENGNGNGNEKIMIITQTVMSNLAKTQHNTEYSTCLKYSSSFSFLSLNDDHSDDG